MGSSGVSLMTSPLAAWITDPNSAAAAVVSLILRRKGSVVMAMIDTDLTALAGKNSACVPIVRTRAGNLAPTGISRVFGCVRIVRGDVREGSFGDPREWSLLVVTANGHWLSVDWSLGG